MKTLKSIANSIYETCFNVDRHITGYSEIDATLWARANAVRHAHTIRAILNYAYQNNKKTVKILNASGLGCGHQDFSIVSFLRNNTNIKPDWVAFDSPNSGFLTRDLFRKYIKDLKIKLEFSDFSKTDRPYGEGEDLYDIVIFTEIAEHLDHSTLLNLFAEIRNKIKKDGILIITTPNLVDVKNRIRILFGNGDGPYWGDTPQTTKNRKGFYGHIVNYDINRLKRLMHDIGYKINNAYTFTYGYGPSEKFLTKRLMYRIIDFLSFFLKNSRKTLLIIATKNTSLRN
ncbi:hypothetical protein KAU51_02380 [Candidatus Parcubacteria bacterium]|nr:hypothetical protein [Candidatus Parcubacteria bacterium]